ncbi:MAG TPA: glycosyltransferase family 4 protein [Gemmatimonadales bacterium]|jgi:Fuc2NAc and GlcNAc transferase
MTGHLAIVGGSAWVASLLLSWAVLRYAIGEALLDLPNERSSHTTPTPRGGGLAIVLVILGGLAILAATGEIDGPTGAALVGGGGLIAVVGWMDDRRHLPAVVRFACQIIAAVWAVAWLGGMPTLTYGSGSAHVGAAGAVIATLAIVWAINFYNFMDGIDGLAAGEAATAGLAATLLLASRHSPLAGAAVLIAGAAAGFLPWNWERARIFMGDVGSGFLGFVFAALALASENSGAMPTLVWLLLLAVFFVDATVTLFRRIFRREDWYAAHRAHAYQRAVQGGWSHAKVVSAVLLLNLLLAVLAWVAIRSPDRLPVMLLLAGVLLGGLYLAVERWRPMVQWPRSAMEKPVP